MKIMQTNTLKWDEKWKKNQILKFYQFFTLFCGKWKWKHDNIKHFSEIKKFIKKNLIRTDEPRFTYKKTENTIFGTLVPLVWKLIRIKSPQSTPIFMLHTIFYNI